MSEVEEFNQIMGVNEEMVVYKYEFIIGDTVEIGLPYGAEVLHVGYDPRGVTCIWARVVVAKSDWEMRKYLIKGTGHKFKRNEVGRYVATILQGMFVWHMFEPGCKAKDLLDD